MDGESDGNERTKQIKPEAKHDKLKAIEYKKTAVRIEAFFCPNIPARIQRTFWKCNTTHRTQSTRTCYPKLADFSSTATPIKIGSPLSSTRTARRSRKICCRSPAPPPNPLSFANLLRSANPVGRYDDWTFTRSTFAMVRRQPPSTEPLTGELVVRNGPDRGVSRALLVPVTLVGSGESCDLRILDLTVRPVHCVVAVTPEGPLLRDRKSVV